MAESVSRLMTQGGPVMVLLFVLASMLCWCILERGLYFFLLFSSRGETRGDQYCSTPLAKWAERRVARGLVATRRSVVRKRLGLIASLVAIAPLCGLLGTITGMIEVFEVVSISGSPEIESLGSGIAKATIPTMVGMTLAIIGLVAWYSFSALAVRGEKRLAQLGEADAHS